MRRVLMVAAVLVVAVGACIWWTIVYYPSIPPSGDPLIGEEFSNEQERYWESAIRTMGGRKAWKMFTVSFPQEDPGRQHRLAHGFGALLYDIEGVDGVTSCDGTFSYGCLHEFFGWAIHAMGVSSTETLNERCLAGPPQQTIPCQHGIGHGITATLGYTFPDLEKALSICDGLQGTDSTSGCVGGVLMEYNLRTILSVDSNVGVREYTAGESVYSPCEELSQNYRQACYFWQPQWWMFVFRNTYNRDELWKSMTQWCTDVPDVSARTQCYRGVGAHAVGRFSWDKKVLAQLCTSAIADKEGAVACRDGAQIVADVASPIGGGDIVPPCVVFDERSVCVSKKEEPSTRQ